LVQYQASSFDNDTPFDEGQTELWQMNWELEDLLSDVQYATNKAQSLEMNMELNKLAASVKVAR
jgi:hypothetical protein